MIPNSKWFKFPVENIPNMVTRMELADEYDFTYMVDMLFKESNSGRKKTGYFKNRDIMAAHFRDNELYVLKFDFDQYKDQFIGGAREQWDETMPAFCALNGDGEINMLWVQEDMRRMGLGTRFVQHFNVKRISHMPPEAEPFWNKVGVAVEWEI
jgi:GNAT superfamily N-acetyltransferase